MQYTFDFLPVIRGSQTFEIGSGDPRHVGGYAAVTTGLMNVWSFVINWLRYCSAFSPETTKVRTVVNARRIYDVASAVLHVLYV